MTEEQFSALVKLMRGGSETPSNIAARMVLVDGVTHPEAMKATGCTRQSLHNTVKRYKAADALISEAYQSK
jgi:hypothetical protein